MNKEEKLKIKEKIIKKIIKRIPKERTPFKNELDWEEGFRKGYNYFRSKLLNNLEDI